MFNEVRQHSKTIVNLPSETNGEDDHRITCTFCTRKFNPDVVVKHSAICEQNYLKKNGPPRR